MKKRTQIEDLEATIVRRRKIYARCEEAALAYSICENTVKKIAKEANAIRKVHGTCLVNTKILTEYIEQIWSNEKLNSTGTLKNDSYGDFEE